MMRVMLYEAAQSMLRSKKWSWLKAWAMQIATHRGVKKAIVHAATQATKRAPAKSWLPR
jgi:transposase